VRRSTCVRIVVLLGTLLVPTFARAADPLADADQRIDKHRKADATVRVVDASGQPVANATVQVRQTRHAFLFGCNIFKWREPSDLRLQEEYRRRFAELLNYATVPFYWPMYESRRGEPRHEPTEEVAHWCRAQGILTKGHPLAWNFAEPGWLPEDPLEVYRLQRTRIDDCVRRFAGLIDRWDVVNEATHFDRKEFFHRAPKLTGMWQHVGQMEFTRECFRRARQANPAATLLINDYRVDPPYEKVIEQLVDEQGRRLYDVIGIQSHMHGGAWSSDKTWEVCQRFARFQVPLHFTETTILSGQRRWDEPPRGTPWPSTPEGEAYQVREVVRLYTLLFSHPAVEALTWWDFSDHGAWKGAPAGLLRADMTPKPAYEELAKLIKGRWWTKTELQTGPDGLARFRGFLGDYQIALPDRKAGQAVHLGRDEKQNAWTLILK